MNDEYFIWAVVIAVVVVALMYSWNSREHFVREKCWGAEQALSASTGYMDGTKYMQGYFSYLTYLGEKLTSQGKCSGYKDALDCANRNVLALAEIATLDTAKTFCATANCMGIVKTPAGNGVGGIYVPYTGEFTKEVPKGPDGKEIPAEYISQFKIILPVACQSSTTNEYAGNKAVEEAQAKYKAEEDKRAKELLDAADWLAKNKTLSPDDFTKAWEKKYGSVDSTMTEEEWLKRVTGATSDKSMDSHNRAIDAVGAPAKDATSTLGSVSGMSGMNGKWQQGPKGSVGDSDKWATPGDAYILKSSLVPCTCTKHSMGCERHSGSKQESFAPGDLDGNFQYRIQPQSGLMRPFSQAFLNQGEPTGFLNTFSAFA